MLDNKEFLKAAKIIWSSWNKGNVISNLPNQLIPKTRSEAYSIQSCYEKLSKFGVFGWKIAATSKAGQKHIGASGPMAGRILNEKSFSSSEKIDLSNNMMSVAELEFVFKIAKTLKPKNKDYIQDEVLLSVENLYSGIEFPNSRFGSGQILNLEKCWLLDWGGGSTFRNPPPYIPGDSSLGFSSFLLVFPCVFSWSPGRSPWGCMAVESLQEAHWDQCR